MITNYWLEGWFEVNRIRSIEDAMKIVSDPIGFREMVEVAAQWNESPPVIEPSTEEALLAGPGLSRTIGSDCKHESCIQHKVENLLRHSLHYYSEILLPDVVGSYLLSDGSHFQYNPSNNAFSSSQLTSQLNKIHGGLIFYEKLRKLGVLPLIQFFPRISNETQQEIDRSLDYDDWNDEYLDYVKFDFDSFLEKGIQYDWVETGLASIKHLSDPTITRYYNFLICDMDENSDIAHIKKSMFCEYVAEFLENSIYSKQYQLSVGHTDPIYSNLEGIVLAQYEYSRNFGRYKYNLGDSIKVPKIDSLKIPSLNNISLQNLVELRLNKPEHFDLLRKVFRNSIAEIPDDMEIGAYFESEIILSEVKKLEENLIEAMQKFKRELYLGAGLLFVSTTLSKPSFNSLLIMILSALKGPLTAYLDYRKVKEKNPFSIFWKNNH